MMNDNEDTLETVLAIDRKASELAKIILVKKGTDKDHLTDLSKDEIAYLSVLSAIQQKIKSTFLESLIDNFIVYRKSHKRKSKKELVEMFKALKEEEPNRFQQFRDLLGVG